MNIFGYQLALRTLALIAGLLVLVGLALYIPSCVQKQRSAAAQARMNDARGEAAVASGKDASEAQATVNRNEVASEALGRENERTIRNAQGSDAVVAAPARNAGMLALCRRQSYRDSEQCKLLNAR